MIGALVLSVAGLPRWLVVENPPANAGDVKMQVQSLGWEDPLEEGLAPVSLTGESHGQRSLVGYIVHRAAQSDTTEGT